MDTGETFSLLMESMVARFMDLSDEDINAQRERILAQKRWADMELLAMDTAKRLQRQNAVLNKKKPDSL